MPFKRIVCLANSQKYNHRCIAGREIGSNGFGDWIRPVSKIGVTGELTLDEMSFEDNTSPNILDIVTVPLLDRAPHGYQTENYFVDDQFYWVKHDTLTPDWLYTLCERPRSIWTNGNSSTHGVNDRVSEDITKTQIKGSLMLIKPEHLAIIRTEEFDRQRVRGEFIYQRERYRLMITDPAILDQTLGLDLGTYVVGKDTVYLCVSLGEPFHGHCYKLIAGVLPGL